MNVLRKFGRENRYSCESCLKTKGFTPISCKSFLMCKNRPYFDDWANYFNNVFYMNKISKYSPSKRFKVYDISKVFSMKFSFQAISYLQDTFTLLLIKDLMHVHECSNNFHYTFKYTSCAFLCA